MAANPVLKSREEIILEDLNQHFPEVFHPLTPWKLLSRGEDPPDAIGISVGGKHVGLELTEWLHGDQMTRAKGREAMRKDLARILDWKNHPKPQNFQIAIVGPRWGTRVKQSDAVSLCREFHAAIYWADNNWESESRWPPVILMGPDLQTYPVLNKYVACIQFLPGKAGDLTQYGISWIDFQLDGGAYDPNVASQALIESISDKAAYYETAERVAHLERQELDELLLLVHGGFNQAAYNTPFHAPWKSLTDVAREAAFYCAANSTPFNQVWLFHSLGNQRSLAQLSPEFHFHPSSS
jgi:hypothetical protein